jgi:protein involved in polysaccharide export with SLBB domain
MSSFTQELDEDYLASLPEDIRSDLLKKVKDGDENFESPVYRRQSSALKKNTNKDNEFDEEELEDSEEGDVKKVYGHQFFDTIQTTFMPVNEPNFNPSYILDYGDVLEIQLIGQKNTKNTYELYRDGSIVFPDIGKLTLAGMTLMEANKYIKSKVSNIYIGTEAFVSIINIRDINVVIAGNAYNPGVYTISGNSNALHALSMAGGVDEFGSYRNIKVKRDNKIIGTIDLYELLIYGNNVANFRLQSGDIIFVEPYINRVTVTGAVKRPHIYELVEGESLEKALFFANGLRYDADLGDITLERINLNQMQSKNINTIGDLKDIPSQDQDYLNFKKFDFREVNIIGAVKRPGTYLMKEGDGILELLERSGGYTANAYPYGGILNNEKTKEINKLANESLYDNLLGILLDQSSSNPQSTENKSLFSIMQQLKKTKTTGRVKAEFNIERLKSDSSSNILLQDKDEVIIPELTNYIYVYGQVSTQGTAKFISGKDIQYYLDNQGGALKSADLSSIYVLLPNGESYRVKSNKNIFMNQNKEIMNLKPGSIIFVPRKIENNLIRMQAIQAYASIISNFGVSVASLAVLNDK